MQTRPYIRRRTLENSHWYMGHLSTTLATAQDTGGAMAFFDVTLRAGMEPPPHVHRHEDEAFFVLDGHLDGYVGNMPLSIGPGELAYLPRELPHGWRATPGIDGATARSLVLVAPGGLEEYFLRFSEPALTLSLPDLQGMSPYAQTMRDDLPAVIASAADYGIEWIPPGQSPTLREPVSIETPCLDVLGEHYRLLAGAAQTEERFTSLLWTSPAQSKLPRHCHARADEAFYVLDGEVAFEAGDDFSAIARPGDFVFLPRCLPHTHRAAGGRPSRAFQIVTPGGVERGLAEVAALSPGDVTLERLAEIAGRAGLELLPEVVR